MVHLFGEQQDWDWDYYNMKTNIVGDQYLVYQYKEEIDTVGVITYEVTTIHRKDEKLSVPADLRTHYYVNKILLDSDEVYQRTLAYARIPAYTDDNDTLDSIMRVL